MIVALSPDRTADDESPVDVTLALHAPAPAGESCLRDLEREGVVVARGAGP